MMRHLYKRISIVLASLLLLMVLPMSAMAENGTDGNAGALTPSVKATASNAAQETATPSNAEQDGELIDGEIKNDLDEEAGDDVLEQEEGRTAPAPEALPAQEGSPEEHLSGTWAADDITVYRFREDGTGALILPRHTFEFGYAVEDDGMVLRFEDGGIGTVAFRFTLEEDALILERAEGGFGEVVLGKTADE